MGKKRAQKNYIFGFSKKYNLKKNQMKIVLFFYQNYQTFHRSLDSSTIFKPKKILKDNFFLFYKNLNNQIKKIYF